MHMSECLQADEKSRGQMIGALDKELQATGVASLVLNRLGQVAAEALEDWHAQFAARFRQQERNTWPGGGVGFLWPQASEMYSHPHYLITVGEDDRTSPSELPHNMQSLLDCMREDAFPVLERLIEHGTEAAPGSLQGKMRIAKVIVHYYPTATAQETLLTHAAFHSDDSFLTLNFENVPGMHGLNQGGQAPCIRRFHHSGLSTYPVNLFVGGYLQALSRGRWTSLIHSGSNPGPADRVSITCFLDFPVWNSDASRLGGVRGSQEGAVHEFLQEAEGLDEETAKGRINQIRRMYDTDMEFTQLYSCAPELAVSHRYAVVGSWDDWSTLHELRPDQHGSTKLQVSVGVPAGQSTEFQILRDGDWNQRIFPHGSRGTGAVLGPSPDGHGRNWKLDALPHRSTLNIKWDASTGSIQNVFDDKPEPIASAKPAGTQQLHRLGHVPRRACREHSGLQPTSKTIGARRAFQTGLGRSSMLLAALASVCLKTRRLKHGRL